MPPTALRAVSTSVRFIRLESRKRVMLMLASGVFLYAKIQYGESFFMPTLNWIGKDAVINHHKEVPFRLLKPIDKLSVLPLSAGEGRGEGAGNLLI